MLEGSDPEGDDSDVTFVGASSGDSGFVHSVTVESAAVALSNVSSSSPFGGADHDTNEETDRDAFVHSGTDDRTASLRGLTVIVLLTLLRTLRRPRVSMKLWLRICRTGFLSQECFRLKLGLRPALPF